MTQSGFDIRFGPISHASEGALYEQIVLAVKREVAAGRLKPGEALPSLRVLAGDLMVSLITVKRAYEELERDGIIYLRQGLGAFVTDAGLRQVRQEKAEAATAALRAAVQYARAADLSDTDIQALLQRIIDQGDQA
ncbi:GntR family transcriptional regulator [Asticcacaulis sp. 201]|uniref:GntR family transcriptional regulator n=1 Tax=Asticcacaulis sp. 201 TaxID=3028787 RepID=UPI0029168CE5|nr:GntR family transcriptional regulator [Asticcacaulis sp. 201]MDV6329970.1 GntR family transcriptional regulator [Asticcacaulis sp. 201]